MGLEKRAGELRLVMLGETDPGRCLVVIWTPRRNRVRVVTRYPPGEGWSKLYREGKGKGVSGHGQEEEA